MRKIIIYCDESVLNGPYYSNFYGGALLEEKDYDKIIIPLKKKTPHHLIISQVELKASNQQSFPFLIYAKAKVNILEELY